MRRHTTILTALLSIGLASCQQQPIPEESGDMTEPAGDIAAEERAVDDFESRYEQAYAAKDPAAVADFWLEDGRNIYHDGTEIIGREEIRGEFERFLGGPGAVAIEIQPTKRVVSASGDVAYEIGTYTATGTGTDGLPLSQTHRYLLALRKVDGEWKIDAVMDTAPLASAAEATEAEAPSPTRAE